MKKLNWDYVSDKFPPANTRLLVKFKYGVIDCELLEEESSEKDGDAVGYTYIWRDQDFYIEAWMLYSDFESVCEN